jgi:hypothetical protein
MFITEKIDFYLNLDEINKKQFEKEIDKAKGNKPELAKLKKSLSDLEGILPDQYIEFLKKKIKLNEVRIIKPGEIAKDMDGRPIRPGDIVTHSRFGKGQIEGIDTKTYSIPMVSVSIGKDVIARTASEWKKRG